jgi:spore cortex formation protein SpoVR/YcgB (stage V sporulation)
MPINKKIAYFSNAHDLLKKHAVKIHYETQLAFFKNNKSRLLKHSLSTDSIFDPVAAAQKRITSKLMP